jgi:mannose-1-phosphate guanylyltransferase/mannose-6-phosphate isomerase
LARADLPELPNDHVLGEPLGRNTAPAVALAAAILEREDPEAVLLVAPADAWIGDDDAFREAATRAVRAAAETRGLVTFGIRPTSAETGYGYIEVADEIEPGLRRVRRFTEKPDRATAEAFVAGGRHFWNSGMFAWRADVFLEELSVRHAEMATACRKIALEADRESALAAAYPKLTSISVDYAVLEHSDRVLMVETEFAWSDVGSWSALSEVLRSDASGNVVEGDALVIDSKGCFVRSSSRFTAAIGLQDMLVIDLPDALLVCPKERAQDVKRIVDALEAGGRRDLL